MNRASDNTYLEIDLADFGPIRNAKIDLRPLTIFVGPSNTGKSYLAILIYALHRSISGPSHRFFRAQRYRSILGDIPEEISDKDISNLSDWGRQLLTNNVFQKSSLDDPLPEPVVSIIRPLLQGSSSTKMVFHNELIRCFGIDRIDPLIRYGNDMSRIVIRKHTALDQAKESNIFRYILQLQSADKVTVKSTLSSDFPIHLSFEPREIQALKGELRTLARMPPQRSSQVEFQMSLMSLIHRIMVGVVPNILDPIHRNAYYLPADRTGIMHAHRVVVSALVERATFAGLRPPSPLPMLSGVLADFLEALIEVDPFPSARHRVLKRQKRPFGEWIEKEILGGTIQVNRTESEYPSFAYRPSISDHELPLMNASSMVSELAPVVLYLRQTVREGDVLIIEEPESHLHPAMQTAFAKVLARIVKAGVRVIITTHSDWFLEQIGNLMRISDLPEPQRSQIPGIRNSDALLDSNDVGAWLFRPSQDITQGSKVEEIELDRESGRFEVDYDAVREELYDQGTAVYNRLQRTKESRDR